MLLAVPEVPVICCAQMVECRTDRDEEAAVVQCIREQQAAGIPLADIAVLFRTVSQGKAVERALVSILTSFAARSLYILVRHPQHSLVKAAIHCQQHLTKEMTSCHRPICWGQCCTTHMDAEGGRHGRLVVL